VSDIWIVDAGADRVYQYTAAATRTSDSQSAAASFALALGNTNPQGIANPPLESRPLESRLQPEASDSRLKAVLQLPQSRLQPESLPNSIAADDMTPLATTCRKATEEQISAITAAALSEDDEPAWLPVKRTAADVQLELELLDELFIELGQ
jgi:hypothetical protein